jgi:hypothetical protein
MPGRLIRERLMTGCGAATAGIGGPAWYVKTYVGAKYIVIGWPSGPTP